MKTLEQLRADLVRLKAEVSQTYRAVYLLPEGRRREFSHHCRRAHGELQDALDALDYGNEPFDLLDVVDDESVE